MKFLIPFVIVSFTSLSINVYSAHEDKYIEFKEESDRFGVLVKRLNYNPDDLQVGDRLREKCRQEKNSVRCIDALNDLSKKHPKNKSLRYQAALAYVDEVPGHSLFRQGWLSSRSMAHMSKIIEIEPNDWPAFYIRGLNGLYWPTSFRKLPKSIADLSFCIELSSGLPAGLKKPYHALAYIALGDAYVKNGEVEEGRKTYRLGASKFSSSELDKRLGLNDEKLVAFVKDFRHTDQRVDTEISFLLDGGENKI